MNPKKKMFLSPFPFTYLGKRDKLAKKKQQRVTSHQQMVQQHIIKHSNYTAEQFQMALLICSYKWQPASTSAG
jgi:hypothetical protein